MTSCTLHILNDPVEDREKSKFVLKYSARLQSLLSPFHLVKKSKIHAEYNGKKFYFIFLEKSGEGEEEEEVTAAE